MKLKRLTPHRFKFLWRDLRHLQFYEGQSKREALARLKPFRKRMEAIRQQHYYPQPEKVIAVVKGEVRVVRREQE